MSAIRRPKKANLPQEEEHLPYLSLIHFPISDCSSVSLRSPLVSPRSPSDRLFLVRFPGGGGDRLGVSQLLILGFFSHF
ncbi:hypothetical protein GN956_G18506 [Arapaima gigas]